jgi:hypothetical protein
MNSFSEALSMMDLSGFEPHVCAEADDKAVQVSEEAAISRLRLILDGLGFWGVHGGAVTGSGGPAPNRPWAMSSAGWEGVCIEQNKHERLFLGPIMTMSRAGCKGIAGSAYRPPPPPEDFGRR